MDITHFDIPKKPVPASRPRVTKWGTYYPKAHTDHAGYLKDFLPAFKPGETLTVPIEVRVLCVMPRYKTSEFPTYRGDVDNLAKLPLDSMTKAEFWTDDCLIVVLNSMKRFVREGEEPHTKIKIKTIEGDVESHIDRLFDS